jgi:predicted nucleic acid-binding protein
MTFSDIPAGAAVFVDANVFVYHFAPHPSLQAACQQLLERFASEELIGHTSAHVLTNVAHRMMTLEAVDRFSWPTPGIAQRLQRHPDQFRLLTRFSQRLLKRTSPFSVFSSSGLPPSSTMSGPML